MNTVTYAIEAEALARDIITHAQAIKDLEEARVKWTKPNGTSIHIAGHITVVRADNTVCPGLEGVQREVLAYIDDRLHRRRSLLEGTRFKLANLGRSA